MPQMVEKNIKKPGHEVHASLKHVKEMLYLFDSCV